MVKSTKGGGATGGTATGGGGRRGLTVRVKTAKGRKIASTRWLQRQLNDPYVDEAKRQGYRSRAAFKLIEIDDKYHLLTPGKIVIDLGAAPGGWSQVAAARVKSAGGKGRVIAADLNEIKPVPGVDFMVLDVTDADAGEKIRAALVGAPGGKHADVVMSDMAASSIGHRSTDHLRVIGLAEAALDIAEDALNLGGAYLAKVLQGGAGQDLVTRLRQGFTKVAHVKPKASRADSSEVYVLATGFRGAPSD
ncbi:MAG TPA: RlmE family RNA methyltransferase [Methyloceanibacter sp.]|nr:RlmE family RNA methyltransferase [Methyloceanibacter sp.]